MKNLTFHIVGLTHNDVKGHEVEYAKEAEGRTICLVPDDANTFDMLAVKAYDKQQLIGYVSALEGEDVRALITARKERNLRAIEDFIVWSVKYDLWCKMRFFGNQMQEAIDADSRSVCHTPGVSNLLLYVHDTFDKTEIQNICQVHGTKTKLAILLCNWKKRGFIMKNEDGTFTKTARFIAKYGHYGTPGVAA